MEETNDKNSHSENIEFKKPVLIGRISKVPKKVKSDAEKLPQPVDNSNEENSLKASESVKSPLPPAVLLKELSTPIPYKEPKWSGICPDGTEYALEVLKSGMIVEKVELTNKPYYVFGRLANCDVVLAHPTISRHHSILQYKALADENEQASGWYLYDLGSTHGTFLNKEKLKHKHYTRVRVGHQIKFGSSTRTYILLGPDYDCEGESELTVTEIKRRAEQMKIERDRMIQEAKEQRERERLEEEKRKEEQGIDWGMGEDADEASDLADNPYAVTTNEELYLDDPKKTLRGYFEREGHELNYDCEERGVGQFICRVELPIDDPHGRPVKAEVIHRGKKKEAVVACALEACRILDRAGLLRQAKHESRRRKQRDWSADDYYDSDEDTFLDRTGSVEKKRQQRMRKHGVVPRENETALTYDQLLKQISEIEMAIENESKSLESLRSNNKQAASDDSDALDEFMKTLPQSMAHKADISAAKMNIQKLKSELAKTQRLADLARPAHMPPIIKRAENTTLSKQVNSVLYGKRIKLKEDLSKKVKVKPEKDQIDQEFVEEMDSDEEDKTGNKDSSMLIKIDEPEVSNESNNHKDSKESQPIETQITMESTSDKKRVFGPMRPPENYIVPESYFDQESDRDLPEIEEKNV
ncbi:kanadaptin [Pieris brassicae]|uniref:kanadaptin n=1 Tax=Pieris brassicae TaxID=7116 RepID=UPI001E6609B8|nr:kanadaptin [Pieris brassicae]